MDYKYKVSVNILNWNRKDDVCETIKALENQTFKDFEIVVVDNASTDGSYEMILSEFPHVRLIRSYKNLGVAGGRNLGIVNSFGEIIFFLDNDAILQNDGLEKIVKRFEIESQLGIIGIQVVNYYTKEHQREGWAFGPHNLKRKDEEFEVWTFPGGASAIKREVFDKVGLFADHYFFAAEENDFGIRAIKENYKILYYPEVKIFHKLSPTKRFDFQSRTYFYGTRNSLWIYWTHYTLPVAIKESFFFMIKRFLYSIRQRAFLPYLKGIFSAFAGLNFIIKLRKPMDKATQQYYIQLSAIPPDKLSTKLKRFIKNE